jgi:cell wall assembly regulator SMI1
MNMEEVIKNCDLILTELNKFSKDMINLGPAISDDRLEIFENELNFELPVDFKYILKRHNGISLSGNDICGIGESYGGQSLDKLYEFEHDNGPNKMPLFFLPFSPDGFGNHYCLNLSKNSKGICPIVFWQHDFIYEDLNDVEECNANLTEWIKEVLIEWTLEDYSYDGAKK